MKLVSFATGNLWRWIKGENRNKIIDYARKLDVDGLEITFASCREVENFKLSSRNLSWIKTLKYVSIHAPFNLSDVSGYERKICLAALSKLYRLVRAENLVIHPEELPSREELGRYSFKVSTENMPNKKRYNSYSLQKLEKLLRDYPRMGLCLDVSHAYGHSPNMVSRLVKRFKKRITQVHFSGNYRRKDHTSLKIVTKRFIKSIGPIKALNVPIVIEESIRRTGLRAVAREVEYAKGIILQ